MILDYKLILPLNSFLSLSRLLAQEYYFDMTLLENKKILFLNLYLIFFLILINKLIKIIDFIDNKNLSIFDILNFISILEYFLYFILRCLLPHPL
jgi:hypothetical protein